MSAVGDEEPRSMEEGEENRDPNPDKNNGEINKNDSSSPKSKIENEDLTIQNDSPKHEKMEADQVRKDQNYD